MKLTKWSKIAIYTLVLIIVLLLSIDASVRVGSGNFNLMPVLTSSEDWHLTLEDCDCDMLHKLWLTQPYTVDAQAEDVKQALSQLGFFDGEINTTYDPAVADAVRRFQNSVGYESTGIVDTSTWNYLASEFEKNKSGSSKLEISKEAEKIVDIAIVVDISNLTLTLYENGIATSVYTVGVGSSDTPTPLGDYVITEKKIWSGGFGSRWMGLNVPWGTYGIHGTNKPWSIGYRKSAGCVRMFNQDIAELYSKVKVGTPVKIMGGSTGDHGMGQPTIEPGDRGWHVLIVQRRLKELGYYSGGLDGKYGITTEKAVIAFQKDAGLTVSSVVGSETYNALGLIRFD